MFGDFGGCRSRWLSGTGFAHVAAVAVVADVLTDTWALVSAGALAIVPRVADLGATGVIVARTLVGRVGRLGDETLKVCVVDLAIKSSPLGGRCFTKALRAECDDVVINPIPGESGLCFGDVQVETT